jgi:hypothetical protein
VQVSACLVDAYGDSNCFGEVSFFVVSNVSKWNKATIKFCLKLKKTATETFAMFKSVYGEERLCRRSVCVNGIKGSKKGEKLRMQESRVKKR